MVAGVSRPQLGCTPKDTVWTAGRCELWHYRSDNVTLAPPVLIIYSLLNRSFIVDLAPGNSFIEKLLKAGFDVYMLDWGVPDERDSENTFEDYVDDYIPGAVGGSSRSAGPTRSTCSAIASAGSSRCFTPRTTPTHRCAALP